MKTLSVKRNEIENDWYVIDAKNQTLGRLSSKIANYIRRSILNDDCEDTGCSLKVFDRKIFLQFPFFL